MLKLEHLVGSIVQFEFTCSGITSSFGKVIEVTDDEVVLVIQEYVCSEKEAPFKFVTNIDYSITIDSKMSPIHIDRSLIASWRYFKFCKDSEKKDNLYTQEEFKEMVEPERINRYNADGFCIKNNSEYD